ncbi:calcium-binding protein E63-1 isoform X1 [Anopheles maculipalpis]|uniref:calcium-binding protein E63-1 isoform X1 n=1 Tax=Anopheles maculipalpis TaxID=1496333 RepID=UPI002158C0C5|nr:calcium-binding protein E63-1 isoform X1 [Anopheles maculipalpis]
MSSGSPTMGAEGKMACASRAKVADSHSVQLLGTIETSPSSSLPSSLPAEVNFSSKEHTVDSNFLTPRAAREGTPPRADAQIEIGLPPRASGCASGCDSGCASTDRTGSEPSIAQAQPTAEDAQPKKKVIRRIVKVRRVVKKMKKKDEKFYLRTAFDLLDRDQDGHVTPEELQFMLRNLGIHVRDELIDDLLREASRTGSGLIDETEFLQWVARIKALKDDSNTSSSSSSSNNPAQSADDDLTQDLVAAFRVFDRDGNGYITRDELKSAMDMIGENVTEYQLNEMLELADADKDGRINYEDFQNFFLNNFDTLVQPPKK